MEKITSKKKAKPYIGHGKTCRYNKQCSILFYIDKQIKIAPNSIAIIHKNKKITYAELSSEINKMANYFLSKNIKPGDKIAVYLEPSIDLVITILASLKISGVYIPLDVSYPADRIDFMLSDSQSTMLVTDSIKRVHITYDLQIINVDTIKNNISFLSNKLKPISKGSDLAYIIYTSGSTGVPKGVVISHKAVNNHMLWMKKNFSITSSDTILLKTPISFDPSIWEILLPFYCGSKLIIAPAGTHIDPDLLIDTIVSNRVNIVQFVPSVLKLFLENKRINECKFLSKVFVGGETLRSEIKELFFHKLKCELINLYGPTEATIDISSYQVSRSKADINTNIIGHPIFNTSLYVVNSENKLSEIGEEGELYIGSNSLSYGYHARETLTQDHFIPNPFEPKKFPYIYKTGDLVRWLPSKELEYIGRNNDQFKINGVRIEPKELILTILKNKEISDCIVVKKIDSHGHDYLACYLTVNTGIVLDFHKIKESLKNKFPSYMLPKMLIPIEKIPLTINGKVDTTRLPSVNFDEISKKEIDLDDLSEEELKILLIWRKLLESNQIDINDNFFELGGNSLLAIKLISILQKEFNITLKIRDLMLYQTIKEQAAHLINIKKSLVKNHRVTESNPLIALNRQGNKNPLFLIHPIGGTIFWYIHLAKLLGKERPIYSFQDPSIEIEKPILNSIQEMASLYLSHIKIIKPKGPYLIGGASFGATVAIEIARLLKNENECTVSIVILDGWGVYPDQLLDDNYFKSSMLRQHSELSQIFQTHGLPKPDVLFDIQWHRLNLLWSYHLELIESPILLFKSKELLPAFSEIDAPHNHWEKFTNNKIDTITVPGNHETMFQEPHVHELANLMTRCFKKNGL